MEQEKNRAFSGMGGRPALSTVNETFRQAGEIKLEPAKEHVLNPEMVDDTIAHATEEWEKTLLDKYLSLMESPALTERKNVLVENENKRQQRAAEKEQQRLEAAAEKQRQEEERKKEEARKKQEAEAEKKRQEEAAAAEKKRQEEAAEKKRLEAERKRKREEERAAWNKKRDKEIVEEIQKKSEAYIKKYGQLALIMNKFKTLDFKELGTQPLDKDFVKKFKEQNEIPDFEVKDQKTLDEFMDNANITKETEDYRELHFLLASAQVYLSEVKAGFQTEYKEINRLVANFEAADKEFQAKYYDKVRDVRIDVGRTTQLLFHKRSDLYQHLEDLGKKRRNSAEEKFKNAKDAFTAAVEAEQKKVFNNHAKFAEKCQTNYNAITKAERDEYQKVRKEYAKELKKLKKAFKSGDMLSDEVRKAVGQQRMDSFVNSLDADYRVKLAYYDNIEKFEKFKLDKKRDELKKELESMEGVTFAAENYKGEINDKVKLEDVSEQQYADLRRDKPALARSLLIKYRSRNVEKCGIKRMNPAMGRVPLMDGCYSSIKKDEKGDGATVTYRRLVREGNYMMPGTYESEEEGKTLKVYPDPRSLYAYGNVVVQGNNNYQGYGGICGPASTVNVVNQLYRMQLTNENFTVDMASKMDVLSENPYSLLDKDGKVITDEKGKEVKSTYYDYSHTGGTSETGLQRLLDYYGLKSEIHIADEPKADPKEMAKRIRSGEQVLMSVNSQLLESDGEGADLKADPEILERVDAKDREEFKQGKAKINHWINVCGVYYPEGAKEGDEPAGFLIKNTGGGIPGFRMVETKQLFRAFRGGDGFQITKDLGSTRSWALYVKKPVLSDEQNKAQETYEKEQIKKREDRTPDEVLAELSGVVDEYADVIEAERQWLDQTIEQLLSDAKLNVSEVRKTKADWQTKRRAESLKYTNFFADNEDRLKDIKELDGYPGLIEKQNNCLRRNAGRIQFLDHLLTERVRKAKGTKANTDVTSQVKSWATETDTRFEPIRRLQQSGADAKQDGGKMYEETRKVVREAINAGLRLSMITKADYEDLLKNNYYAAMMLMRDYDLKSYKPDSTYDADAKMLRTPSGDIRLVTGQEGEGQNTTVTFSRKLLGSDALGNYRTTNKKETYRLSHDLKAITKGTMRYWYASRSYVKSGGAMCAGMMVNRLYGKRLTSEEEIMTTGITLGLIEEKPEIERDRDGAPVENVKPGQRKYMDPHNSGYSSANDLKELLGVYGVEGNSYEATDTENASVEKIVEYVKAGKAVSVYLNRERLYNRNTVTSDPGEKKESAEEKNARGGSMVMINAVYMDKDGKARGFLVRDPRGNSDEWFSLEEFERGYLGTEEKPVTGSYVLVADLAKEEKK